MQVNEHKCGPLGGRAAGPEKSSESYENKANILLDILAASRQNGVSPKGGLEKCTRLRQQ